MSWLLGAGLGFLRGGPFGAIVGGAAQHFATKKVRNLIRKGLPGIENESVFGTCIVVVLTQFANLKSQITAGEVEVIYRFFTNNLNYSAKDLESINHVIRETLKANPPLQPVIEKYKSSSHHRYRSLLLALVYQIILVENSLDNDLQERINEVARLLNISIEDHDRIRERYSLNQLSTPYSILGISANSPAADIKKAYWKLAAQYHPDKVSHLGQDMAEEAHIKFLQIQEAYQELGKIHSL